MWLDLIKNLRYARPGIIGASAILLALFIISIITDNVTLWKLITHLGDEEFYVGIFPVIYHGISRSLGFGLLLTFCSSMWCGTMLKDLLKLPRPPRHLWRIMVHGYGFPSGHALGTTTFWSYLALKLRMVSLALLAAIIITAVSYSRIALRVHYIHDVLGGISIGVLIPTVSILIEHILLRRMLSLSTKLALVFVYGLALLSTSIVIGLVNDYVYMICGVIMGSGTGHVLLTHGSPSRRSMRSRVLGSLLGMIIGGILYYFIIRRLIGLHLMLGFMFIGFVVTYIIGSISDRL